MDTEPTGIDAAVGGLVVWGAHGSADLYCWLAHGEPEDWPVVLFSHGDDTCCSWRADAPGSSRYAGWKGATGGEERFCLVQALDGSDESGGVGRVEVSPCGGERGILRLRRQPGVSVAEREEGQALGIAHAENRHDVAAVVLLGSSSRTR